jgi:acetyltransferase
VSAIPAIPATGPIATGDAPPHRLEPMFAPRSVAVAGDLRAPGSALSAVLRKLLEGDYPGRVDLVDPAGAAVLGRPALAAIDALAAPPDLAVLDGGEAALEDRILALARLGTRHALVVGPALPPATCTRLRGLAQSAGMRLLGPGSLGVARPGARLDLTAATARISPGPLAIVSQSSAVCAALLDFAEGSGVGLSTVASTGVDVDVAAVLDYLAFDGSTRGVVVYMEGVHDARRLLTGLRALARTKPVVVLKAGGNDVGSRARLTHSDVVASDRDTFEAAMRRCGAVPVESFGELFSAVEWLANGRRVRGERLAIVTNGGGLATLAADACRACRVELATLTDTTVAALATELPDGWSGGNPVNATAAAPARLLARTAARVAEDAGADALLGVFCGTPAASSAAIAHELLAQPPSLPAMVAFVGGADAQQGRDLLNREGHSVFETPDAAVRAFSILLEYQRSQRNLLEAPPPLRGTQSFDEAVVRALIDEAIAGGRDSLDEVRSKRLLAACGIPVPRTEVARTVEEAARIADRIGYPVALKVVSPDIVHKSDVAGVRLDIRDRHELRGAASAMQQRLRAASPPVRLEGFAVQPMIRRGHAFELLVGVSRDPDFGPVITFGAGGVAVEATADAATALPPLNPLLARDLIARTRIARLLAGYRHVPAVSIAAVSDVLVAVSSLVCRFPEIAGMDINPLLADPDGVLALDARIVLDRSRPPLDSRYSHLAIHPYPAELERTVTLRKSRDQVLLRPIRPDDAAMELAFFESLSQTARRWRFLHPIQTLSPEMVARFTQVDYERDMALVALPLAPDGTPQERIVGVARYVREVNESRCEFALVVGDDWQGRGLAGALLGRLIEHARAVGLDTMAGYVDGQNLRMLNFVRRMGFELGDSLEDPSMKVATLRLQQAGGSR